MSKLTVEPLTIDPPGVPETLKAGRTVIAFRITKSMIPKGRTYYIGEKELHPGDRVARGAVISGKPKAPLQKIADAVAPKLPPENKKDMPAKVPGKVTKADMTAHGLEPKSGEITIGQGEFITPKSNVTKDTIAFVDSADDAKRRTKQRIRDLIGDDDEKGESEMSNDPRNTIDEDAWARAEGKTSGDPEDPWAGVDIEAEERHKEVQNERRRDNETPELYKKEETRRRNATLLGDDPDENDFGPTKNDVADLAEERRKRNRETEEKAKAAKARVEKIVRIDGGAREQLKRFVSRIEACERERKEINADIKEIMATAKGQGFDTKTIRKLIAIRKIDADTREEENAMLDLYMDSLGMNDDNDDND